MIDLTYHLSARQAKELHVRATEIVLALPVPIDSQRDWQAWARSVLTPQESPLVTAAARATVRVAAPALDAEITGMANWLGIILVGDGPPVYQLTYAVVLVTLTPPRTRHREAKPQWPHYALFNGRRYPDIDIT